ncbi:hypothetical protein M430DRAFT_14558 [Amorphotheca resinae ATCC 22711]|uniref:Uncharacterized protein n=1 Tax=Amorphotheca resinae ATCC 22711 TaxID=857342 RepID=A0A2T3BD25_AMORE|nr:hypothetical protein M430DRAFT_14558 [Amorphotheca resinae ATCC 22711]PSS27274.1 hypothetical protein M430DRAFT_14558 [Amorphotheca resinae ATCC 22711]
MAHLPGGPSIRGKLSAAAPRIALLAIQHAGAPPALSDRTAHIQLHPLQSYTAVRGPPSAGESRPESSSKKQKGTCAAAMPRRRGRPEGESTEVLPSRTHFEGGTTKIFVRTVTTPLSNKISWVSSFHGPRPPSVRPKRGPDPRGLEPLPFAAFHSSTRSPRLTTSRAGSGLYLGSG